jgi:hypothetical protein
MLIGTADGLYADGAPHALSGHEVAWLSPAADGDWWAIVDGALWRGDDSDWEPVASPPDAQARCCLDRNGTVLVGSDGAGLLQLTDGQLEPCPAFVEAPGRDAWFTPWGGPPDTRSLDADDDAIYVNVHVGGVLRATSVDGPWRPTLDIETDVHEVRVTDHAVLVASARGFGLSRDGGETWAFTSDGLHAPYCRAVAPAGDHVLVSASDGPGGSRGAVYRRPLYDDRPFERCDGIGGNVGDVHWVTGNIDTGWLAAGGSVAACATREGQLFVSEDEGATWSLRADRLPPVRYVVVAREHGEVIPAGD